MKKTYNTTIYNHHKHLAFVNELGDGTTSNAFNHIHNIIRYQIQVSKNHTHKIIRK